MIHTALDHLVVLSPTLGAGIEFVERAVGISPAPGGEHVRMGTHNALLRLGPATYLEVLSPDPNASPPSRARWFGMDDLDPGSPPRLATWVARTNDIQATVMRAPMSLGEVEPMERGHLKWVIALIPDGSMPLGGAAPTLIQWERTPHVASTLPHSGCSLVELEIRHPEAGLLNELLQHIAFDGPVRVTSSPRELAHELRATIETPGGVRVLGAS